VKKVGKKRVMSEEGRKRIAEASKKWWAAVYEKRALHQSGNSDKLRKDSGAGVNGSTNAGSSLRTLPTRWPTDQQCMFSGA
jgi:hypothetical protein